MMVTGHMSKKLTGKQEQEVLKEEILILYRNSNYV